MSSFYDYLMGCQQQASDAQQKQARPDPEREGKMLVRRTGNILRDAGDRGWKGRRVQQGFSWYFEFVSPNGRAVRGPANPEARVALVLASDELERFL